MGDSTAMTVEFLRARLLAERSVSKTARQRADELAKRVIELEEQLNLVSLQRKKAEKATADVLAILENHEATGFSEDFFSSSDEEATHCESKVGNNSMKGESSVASKVSKNDKDEFSGSEIESSPVPARSLSWKSGKDSPYSREKKYTSSSSRRRSSSTSTDSASPKRVGKSCRQIRRRETRSAVDELQTDTSKLTSQDNGISTSPEDYPNGRDIEFRSSIVENREEKLSPENSSVGISENHRDGTIASPFLVGGGSDKDMERALEHQAQLIGRYEAEEKAQREWEEKFRENNSSTPDSCEPGNQSDITEERDDINAPSSPHPVGTILSQDQEAKSKVSDVIKESSKTHPSSFQPPPHVDMGFLQDQNGRTVLDSESLASEFTFPSAEGKELQESSESFPQPPSSSSSQLHLKSSHVESSYSVGEGGKNELSLVAHNTSDELGSVLEALQQARLSLTHKLNRVPLIEDGSIGKSVESSSLTATTRAGESVEVPVGHTGGLFRVLTDFQPEVTSRANFSGGLGSRLGSINYYPDRGISANGGDRFMTIPYVESRFDLSTADNRFLTAPFNQYTQNKIRFPPYKPFSNPPFDVGVPSSHRPLSDHRLDVGVGAPSSHMPYSEPRFDLGVPSHMPFSEPRFDMGVPSYKPLFDPRVDVNSVPSYRRYTSLDPPNLDTTGLLTSSKYSYPSYPDLIPQMPSNERFSRPYSSGESSIIPQGNHYLPSYDNHIRPDMYRQQ